jgi:hypothetical protein
MFKKTPNSKLFIWLLFLLPIAFIIFFYIVMYTIIFRFDLQKFEYLLIWAIFIGLSFFDIIVFVCTIRYPRQMNLFLKAFLLVGLALATYLNFKYALAKQSGKLFGDSYAYSYWLYFGSLVNPPYNLPSYIYEGPNAWAMLYVDSLAFMTGVPFLLILIILPSFLAIPSFFLWVGFSIFYIVIPYKTLKRIGEKIKELLHKRSNN